MLKYEETKLCICGCGKKALLGKEYAPKHSPEARRAFAEGTRNWFQNHPEAREAVAKRNRDNPTINLRLQSGRKAFWDVSENRQWMADVKKQLHRDPVYREKIARIFSSVQHKKVMSDVRQAVLRRPAFRMKMRQIMTSEQYRRKLSASVRTAYEDVVLRQRIGVAVSAAWRDSYKGPRMLKGARDPQKCKQASERMQQFLSVPENRSICVKGAKKAWSVPKSREAMLRSIKERVVSDCTREKHAVTMIVRWKNPVTRQSLIDLLKQAQKRSDVKRKKSIASKRLWRDPAYHKKMQKLFHSKTNPERIVHSLLDQSNGWSYVGDASFWISGKCPDFVNQNTKQVIEVFGDYWHGPEVQGKPRWVHEDSRRKHFEKYGWQCLIIWERELKDLATVKRKIRKFCVDTPA